MDFDQKLGLDHTVGVAYFRHEYFVDDLHTNDCNRWLSPDYVELMLMRSINKCK